MVLIPDGWKTIVGAYLMAAYVGLQEWQAAGAPLEEAALKALAVGIVLHGLRGVATKLIAALEAKP